MTQRVAAPQILVIDEGTTGTRAVLVDRQGAIVARAYQEVPRHHPRPGWVEQDPEEIWRATRAVCREALDAARAGSGGPLAAIAVANQRSTSVLWDRRTGEPVDRAIVWQDGRTAGMVDALSPRWARAVHRRTGLVLATTHASLVLAWRFEHDPALRVRAERGELAFGTVDSWLVWKLTGGACHATSASNAAATGAYTLVDGTLWDEWLGALGVPTAIFPTVLDEDACFGRADDELFGPDVTITGIVADQQGALFGQRCFAPGDIKCTHGTGTFLDLNTGAEPVLFDGLNTTVAWRRRGRTTFLVESYVPMTGGAIGWLRDGLGLIADAEEAGRVAASVPDSGGVVFVPALAGLGAPHWDPHARGLFIGIGAGTRKAHLVRAVLEGVVLAVGEAMRALERMSGTPIRQIRADGGLARNEVLLQLQADLLEVAIDRSSEPGFTTCLGAAFIAGLATGLWRDEDEVNALRSVDRRFTPATDPPAREDLGRPWQEAVRRAARWLRATSPDEDQCIDQVKEDGS